MCLNIALGGASIETNVFTDGDKDPTIAMEQIMRSSLGVWSSRANALARRLVDAGLVVGDLEASVRGAAATAVSGGRMMIEGQTPTQARHLVDCLLDQVPDVAETWIGVAAGENVPLITGWDVAGARPAAKLYVNLSDASLAVRQRVGDQLLGPQSRGWPIPHVIGANLVADGYELKLYTQHGELPDEAHASLAEWVQSADQPLAGFVTSYSVGGRGGGSELAPRAHFVGLRSTSLTFAQVAEPLPGWSKAAALVAPFAPGPVTSLGFATSGEPWTLYFKPRSHAGSTWGLDPALCLRCDAGEIGVYVAAPVPGQRAYANVGGYAVSYRVREGKPAVADVETVMAWVIQRVEAGKLSAPQGSSAALPPPEPWHVV